MSVSRNVATGIIKNTFYVLEPRFLGYREDYVRYCHLTRLHVHLSHCILGSWRGMKSSTSWFGLYEDLHGAIGT
jgi:hypothetical protein